MCAGMVTSGLGMSLSTALYIQCSVFDTAVPITFLSLAAQQHEVIAPISLKYVGSCNLFSLSKRISSIHFLKERGI